MAEVVAEVTAVVDELVAAVSNRQQHSSAEVNDDSSSPTEDEFSDTDAEADALVAGAVECEPEDEWTASSQQGWGLGSSDEQVAGMLGEQSPTRVTLAAEPASSGQAASDEAASNEDGAAAGATAKTLQPTVSDALPVSVMRAIEEHEARATWVDSACEGAELMPLPWRGTDNVYVKLARKIEPRDKSASVKSIAQKQIASIGGVEYRVMAALLIHALTPEVSARAHCPVCAICSLRARTTADVPM